MATTLGDDPMVFRPPRRRRGLQLALGVPLTLLVLAPTLFAAWLVWAPHVVELEVDEGLLHITTGPSLLGGSRSVDLAAVASVEEARLHGGKRVAGTALPGYCVGRFSYPELGRVWQATDCSRDVLVLRRDGEPPLLLTPADRDRFLAALETGAGYREAQPPPDPGRGFLAVKVLVLLAPLVGLVVPAVFFVAPSKLRYRIEPGALVVTTVLGSRRFESTGCRVRRHRPRVGMRLWGTGAPGYYTGLFRVDGRNTKVYATSVEEGVLLESDKVRVFVNPENETAFLEAIRFTGGAKESVFIQSPAG